MLQRPDGHGEIEAARRATQQSKAVAVARRFDWLPAGIRTGDHGEISALLRFICEDSGPTAVEYAVMLMMIISVCVGAIGAIGTLADGFFTDAKQTFGSAD